MDDIYDDLGVRNGNQFYEYGGYARQALGSWQPTAVGQRPIDFAKRDLLYGRSRSDGRNWHLRSLLKHKPQFLFTGIPQGLRHAEVIINTRAIQFVHYLKLHRLQQEMQGPLKAKAKQMLSCPPSLYLCQDSNNSVIRNCDLAHLCPFCMSRSAAKVFQHLDKVVFKTERPTPLILLKLIRDIPLGSGREFIKQEKANAYQLCRNLASGEFNSSGGVLTFQLAPSVESKPLCEGREVVGCSNHEGLRLHLNLLTEVPLGFISDSQRHIEDLTIVDELDIAERFSKYQIQCALSVACPPDYGYACGIRQLVFGKPAYRRDT